QCHRPPRQPSLNILKQSLVDVPRPHRSLNARTAAGGCPSTLWTNAFLPQAENSPTSCRDCGRTSLLLNESYGGIRVGLDQNLLTAVPWDNQAEIREQGRRSTGHSTHPTRCYCAQLSSALRRLRAARYRKKDWDTCTPAWLKPTMSAFPSAVMS